MVDVDVIEFGSKRHVREPAGVFVSYAWSGAASPQPIGVAVRPWQLAKLIGEKELAAHLWNRFAFYSPILSSMSRYTKANHRILMQFVRRDVWHVTFLEPGLQTTTPQEADLSR